ncbi:fluoride efflux transporter family protein [Corynebacterium vitaeruminis]|uniref:Fluoride-specific ion channel FluC n=1 Tax=Corynebacterium vitaeruminis DSM 20294 TaxID=1224164 RepID=W5Y3N7_9CORY|nr:fluoride efflux transporter family protein [Corynebacterium vitaeruminis]AHI23514.1 camphor resistance protein CrcB [Corynebacterium vitaeruminis DSM 20294]
MFQAFAVGLGAACGALARYGVTAALGGSALGLLGVLLLINALGSFLMGRFRPPAVFGTGFLGGFTSFSAFALALTGAAFLPAAGYAVLTVVACVGCWWLGDSLIDAKAGR